jgi:dTDP-4-dehydrorhamnose reductase
MQLVTFSTDLVFDGAKSTPYTEEDEPNPLNVYGDSKQRAERAVLDTFADALVIRTSAFFGPWDENNLVTRALDSLQRGVPVGAPDSTIVSPTYVPDLVDATLDLLIDAERGIWHLANDGYVSWLELLRRAAHQAGLPSLGLYDAAPEHIGWSSLRPRYSPLRSVRGWIMPPLDDALNRYIAATRPSNATLPSNAKPAPD